MVTAAENVTHWGGNVQLIRMFDFNKTILDIIWNTSTSPGREVSSHVSDIIHLN